MKPVTADYVYSMSAVEAGSVLGVGPTVVARLVVDGLVSARLPRRRGVVPQWDEVRLDEVMVRQMPPRELARVAARAPVCTVEGTARAVALGMVLRALGQ